MFDVYDPRFHAESLGHRQLASRGGRHSKNVGDARGGVSPPSKKFNPLWGGGLTPLALGAAPCPSKLAENRPKVAKNRLLAALAGARPPSKKFTFLGGGV